MKTKGWKREAKYLYPFILKKDGYITNIRKAIGYYKQYNEMVERATDDPDCPKTLRPLLSVSLVMPKYLEWAWSKLVGKDE